MTTRREFMTALTSVAAFHVEPQGPPAPPGGWDLSWLDRFKGKHKQGFDVGTFDLSADTPLRFVANYFDGFRQALRVGPPDRTAAIGAARGAVPLYPSHAVCQ